MVHVLKKKQSQCHSQRRKEGNRAGLGAGEPRDCRCLARRPWWALPPRPVPALYSSAGHLAQAPSALRAKEKRVSARPRDSQIQLSPCRQQQTASPGAPGDRQSTAPPGPSQPPPAPLLQLLLLRGPSTVSLRNDHK